MKVGLLFCASLLAVDGDTIKCDGVTMRDMGDGRPFERWFDAPEIVGAKCEEEKALGLKAKERMQGLLDTPRIRVIYSGENDRLGRPLVWVIMPDAKSAGKILFNEGLARYWEPGQETDWCDQSGLEHNERRASIAKEKRDS